MGKLCMGFGLCGFISLLAGCSTPTTPAEPEVVRSDAFYAESPRLARQAKRIWDARHPNNYLILVGSADERDYINAVVTKYVPPVFPAGLAAEGIEGYVVVEGVLDSSGKLVEVIVIQSSDRRFEDAAREAFKQWTFQPKRYKGVPIMSVVSQRLEFELK
jgi:TonB family protein